MHAPRLVLLTAVLISSLALAAQPAKPGTSKTAAPAAKPDLDTAPAPTLYAGWKTVTSEKRDFRASFPAEPKKRSYTERTSLGDADVTSYGVNQRRLGVFTVNVYQYKKGALSGRPANETLDGLRDEVLLRWGAKNLMQDVPALVTNPKGARMPARRLEVIAQGGFYISAELILVEDRVYQIIYLRNMADSSAFDQFLSSFTLL